MVLLDAHGRPCGTAPKSAVHHTATPLHLAFSCYVVDAEGRVLLTRRAGAKATWPATWTNACCGHPQPGETLRQAVERHLRAELGMEADRMALALPDFTYRAVMDNGIVEHELCPVVVATASGDVTLAAEEADAAEWVPWRHLVTRAWHAPATLSPWSVRQIDALDAAIGEPGAWLASSARSSTVRRPAARVTAGRCGSPTTEVIDRSNRSGRRSTS